MAATITGTVSDWHIGTTKQFYLTCKIDGVAQDISGDTVTVTVKRKKSDADSSAIHQSNADVASQGSDGIAIVTIPAADTAAETPASVFLDVQWLTAGGVERIVYDGTVDLLERVSDP